MTNSTAGFENVLAGQARKKLLPQNRLRDVADLDFVVNNIERHNLFIQGFIEFLSPIVFICASYEHPKFQMLVDFP